MKTVVEYHRALRVLGNAYCLVGSYDAPSQLQSSTKVKMAPLQAQLDYADMVLRVSSALAAVLWIRDRDEATRGRMVELMRQGWPQGEALTRAAAEQEIHWLSPTVPSSKRARSPEQSATPRKEAKTGQTYKGEPACKRLNDNRGCNNPKCDNQHRCDVLVNGSVCGSKNHSRTQCPHFSLYGNGRHQPWCSEGFGEPPLQNFQQLSNFVKTVIVLQARSLC